MERIEDSEFQDKVVVITGAGGGLGRCHALEFARRGAKVLVNDLGGSVDGTGASDAANKVVAEIEAMGGEAVANGDSVADKEGAKRIIQDAVDAFGTVHILVNNAGILRDRTLRKMDMEDFDLVMQVHMNGSAYVTKAAWDVMYEQRYGRVVLTSSGSGIYGNFGQSNYGAAKMAMLGFMNVLALEGASRNIKVNCLAPGAATRMTATVPGRDVDLENPDPESHPKLVSPAVLFMCQEDAPTGVVINAARGTFSRAQVFVNQGVNLGTEATYEDLAAVSEQLLDMTGAKPRERRTRPSPAK
jgi:NAD(P)-dependent dehydrogenase (short-subunit alcohol dehydrogenase family)